MGVTNGFLEYSYVDVCAERVASVFYGIPVHYTAKSKRAKCGAVPTTEGPEVSDYTRCGFYKNPINTEANLIAHVINNEN